MANHAPLTAGLCAMLLDPQGGSLLQGLSCQRIVYLCSLVSKVVRYFKGCLVSVLCVCATEVARWLVTSSLLCSVLIVIYWIVGHLKDYIASASTWKEYREHNISGVTH